MLLRVTLFTLIFNLLNSFITSEYVVSIGRDSLCTQPVKETLIVVHNLESSLRVNLFNTSLLKSYTNNWTEDFKCEFRVSTSSGGLFAVIQSIVFRSDDESGECVDYVAYQVGNVTSKKYCGERSVSSTSIDAFVEASGQLDVVMFISKTPLRPYRYLELQIVFTSYRFCFQNPLKDDQACSAKYAVHCINKNLFNDGYVNCPYVGCVDEQICASKLHYHTHNFNSFQIAISSILVLLVFSSMIICYTCRKFKKLCWQENQTVYQQPPAYPQVQSDTYVFRAEMVQEAEGLPPTYNSLFPDK